MGKTINLIALSEKTICFSRDFQSTISGDFDLQANVYVPSRKLT